MAHHELPQTEIEHPHEQHIAHDHGHRTFHDFVHEIDEHEAHNRHVQVDRVSSSSQQSFDDGGASGSERLDHD